MNPVWHGLMANLAVVTIVVASWTYVQVLLDRYPPVIRQIALGLLFGLGAVVTILSSFNLAEGLRFDLRTTLIGSATLFGGPVSGLIVATMAAAFRLYTGGAGAWLGCIGIAMATAVSLAIYWVTRRRGPRATDVLSLALLISVTGLLPIFLLPVEHRAEVIGQVAVPSAVVHFVSNLLAGFGMLLELRRRTALRENQTYRTIIEALPDGLNVKDRDGRFIAANPATAALMHADSAADLIGKSDADYYAPPVASRFRQDELEVIAQGFQVRIEQKVPNLDRNPIWLSTLKVPLFDASGAPAGIVTHSRDVTEHKMLEMALEESRGQLSYAIAQMADGVAMFDKNQRLVFCNEQYRASFPLTHDVRVRGVSMRDMLRAAASRGEQLTIPADVDGWIETVTNSLRKASEEEVHLFDGRWLHIRTSPSSDGACMVVVSDISKIKHAESNLLALTAELQQQASTDALTGLLNRRGFDVALDSALERSDRADGWVTLLMMDIDRFKAFNDRYGHQAGDACLKTVSDAFKGAMRRPADIVARYGGEEFVAILPDTDEDGAFFIADAFLRSLRELRLPHAASERGIVTASVGIACYRPGEHNRLGAVLISRADQALYDAKLAGRDRLTGWKERRGLGAA